MSGSNFEETGMVSDADASRSESTIVACVVTGLLRMNTTRSVVGSPSTR